MSDINNIPVELEENTFLDFMEARERALDAAAGYFAVANIPTDHLKIIAKYYKSEIVCLAAEIVLWQRGLTEND